MEHLLRGVNENDSIEKLDLSDNQIKDHDGIFIVRYIKLQAEKRESALWMTGLRHSDEGPRSSILVTEKSISKDYVS